MALRLAVPWERFVEEVRTRLPGVAVYLEADAYGCSVTAGHPGLGLIVESRCPAGMAGAREALSAAGLEARIGRWSLDGEGGAHWHRGAGTCPWVAAVAYVSREPKPGLWMDAYPTEPSPTQVLRAIYEEFRETGELPPVAFEEFIRYAQPNVEVLSPQAAASFAAQKRTEDPERQGSGEAGSKVSD